MSVAAGGVGARGKEPQTWKCAGSAPAIWPICGLLGLWAWLGRANRSSASTHARPTMLGRARRGGFDGRVEQRGACRGAIESRRELGPPRLMKHISPDFYR